MARTKKESEEAIDEKVAEIKFNRDKYLISNQNNFVVTIIFVVRGEVNVFSKQEDTKLLSNAQ